MWLIGFHILVLIMLYGLVTSILVEAMNFLSFQTLENNISEVVHQGDNKDYIIGLCGVKHCTVSNFKCAMSSLYSCLFSFYTLPISLIL